MTLDEYNEINKKLEQYAKLKKDRKVLADIKMNIMVGDGFSCCSNTKQAVIAFFNDYKKIQDFILNQNDEDFLCMINSFIEDKINLLDEQMLKL